MYLNCQHAHAHLFSLDPQSVAKKMCFLELETVNMHLKFSKSVLGKRTVLAFHVCITTSLFQADALLLEVGKQMCNTVVCSVASSHSVRYQQTLNLSLFSNILTCKKKMPFESWLFSWSREGMCDGSSLCCGIFQREHVERWLQKPFSNQLKLKSSPYLGFLQIQLILHFTNNSGLIQYLGALNVSADHLTKYLALLPLLYYLHTDSDPLKKLK